MATFGSESVICVFALRVALCAPLAALDARTAPTEASYVMGHLCRTKDIVFCRLRRPPPPPSLFGSTKGPKEERRPFAARARLEFNLAGATVAMTAAADLCESN